VDIRQPPGQNPLPIYSAAAANPFAQTRRVLFEFAPIITAILWFTRVNLGGAAIAHHAGYDPINVLVRPFPLAVFVERQLVAENPHAAEMGSAAKSFRSRKSLSILLAKLGSTRGDRAG
jgi:hypothetical protein